MIISLSTPGLVALFLILSEVVIVDAQNTTHLFIPGLNAQTVVGGIAGISAGRTTWVLDDRHGKTATLVTGLGSVTATITSSGILITEKACSITLGLALCATNTASEAAVVVETPYLAQIQISSDERQNVPSATLSLQLQSTLAQGPSQTSLDSPAQMSGFTNSALNIASSHGYRHRLFLLLLSFFSALVINVG